LHRAFCLSADTIGLENLQDHLNIGPSVEVCDGVHSNDALSRDPSYPERAREAYRQDHSGPLSQGSVFSFAYHPLSLFSSPSDMDSLRAAAAKSAAETKSPFRDQYSFISKTLENSPSATILMLLRQRNTDAPTLAAARTASQPGNFATIIVMLSHPFSRGSVHIASSSPSDHPLIDPAYLTHPLDVEVLKRHLQGVDRLLTCEPLASFLKPGGTRLPASFPLPLEQMSDEDIERMIRRCVATNYHPTGTCTISDSLEQGGVVDSKLRVHGTRNVRVCDASVLPVIPRGNVLSTVYAVAERGADLIKDGLGAERSD
jgi:choline dehydrogenase-like flavoprotein